MELTLIYTIIGFGLAAYSVIANDSVQTLGTFIAINVPRVWTESLAITEYAASPKPIIV